MSDIAEDELLNYENLMDSLLSEALSHNISNLVEDSVVYFEQIAGSAIKDTDYHQNLEGIELYSADEN